MMDPEFRFFQLLLLPAYDVRLSEQPRNFFKSLNIRMHITRGFRDLRGLEMKKDGLISGII